MKPGDPVKYRALHVGSYPAKVEQVRADGSVDVEVRLPEGEPMKLSKLQLCAADGERGCVEAG